MISRPIIIDSSIVAKWFLKDEPYSELAVRIQHEFAVKRITVSVPLLIFYEINNLLRTCVKGKRIAEEKAIQLYSDFIDLEFTVYSSKELLQKSLQIAIESDISAYDSSYVALAEHLKIPFYTADEKLLQKAKGEHARHLREYTSFLS